MGENGMSKWVIENIELIKKIYVVEAYGEPAAKLAAKAQAPDNVETIAEVSFGVTAINEYEYNKEWKTKTKHKDWIDLAYGLLETPAVEPVKDYYDQ